MAEQHNLTVDELLALLSDASLTPAGIAEEMECAGAGRPTADEVSTARDLLVQLRAGQVAQTAGLEALPDSAAVSTRIGQLSPLLALALVHGAGRAGRQDVLRDLAQGGNRALVKEAKRELQRLKQKGVQVQELRPRGEGVLKPLPDAELPACYASSIDAYGERAVWWARPARQGVEVVQAVLSDVKGVLAADALGLSRRGYREFVKRLPRQNVVTTAEIPKDHARQLIADAEAAGARNGFSPPDSYGAALRLLGPAPATPPPSPGLSVDLGPDGELPHQLASAALFEDPLFMSWIPEEDALRAFALRVDEIAVSQLYLDDGQKEEAFERAAAQAAESYFTPARRALYARRLVEMAHVLACEGRLDAARAALAVSRALPGSAAAPFCRALFTHALRDRLARKPAAAPPPQGTAAPGALVLP